MAVSPVLVTSRPSCAVAQPQGYCDLASTAEVRAANSFPLETSQIVLITLQYANTMGLKGALTLNSEREVLMFSPDRFFACIWMRGRESGKPTSTVRMPSVSTSDAWEDRN